jgi:hypothetical protein
VPWLCHSVSPASLTSSWCLVPLTASPRALHLSLSTGFVVLPHLLPLLFDFVFSNKDQIADWLPFQFSPISRPGL